MEILIARQPIYDKALKVVAYELLYRSNSKATSYSAINGDSATVSVIMGTFLDIGIENVTNRKPGFINFTENLLKSDIIELLPKEYLVIEVLETVTPTEEILGICEKLNNQGYMLALDDFEYNAATKRLIEYAKIIKMDFMLSTDDQLRAIVYKYKNQGIKFLAEKIETKEDFEKAQKYGYEYFQGYYFSKPAVIQNKDILPLQINALRILEMLHRPDCDINEVASIISYDPGMTYKLFKLANSVVYGASRQITKINVALVRIGLKELRTWMLFVVMQGMNKEKPDELIRQSMLRARIAEEICVKKRLASDPSTFSIMGLFSLMNVIMDMPFEDIMAMINISEKVTNALTKPGDDIYGAVIRFMQAYDDADWNEAEKAGKLIGLSLEEYQDIYLESTKWCDERYDDLVYETVAK